MAIKTYKFKIILKNGSSQEVHIKADTTFNAREILKSQYDNPKILTGPTEVR